MWERVQEENITQYIISRTHRMKVAGGWLYRIIITRSGDGDTVSVSTTFVSDPPAPQKT